VATGVVIGLAEAMRLGANVGVDEALADGVGALVQAARSAANANETERSHEFTARQL
jgi:hypothetical protein